MRGGGAIANGSSLSLEMLVYYSRASKNHLHFHGMVWFADKVLGKDEIVIVLVSTKETFWRYSSLPFSFSDICQSII